MDKFSGAKSEQEQKRPNLWRTLFIFLAMVFFPGVVFIIGFMLPINLATPVLFCIFPVSVVGVILFFMTGVFRDLQKS